MTTTKTTYKVKDLIGNWTSLPHNTLEEAQTDMVRLRDRVGMMEWKNKPKQSFVLIKEEFVVTQPNVRPSSINTNKTKEESEELYKQYQQSLHTVYKLKQNIKDIQFSKDDYPYSETAETQKQNIENSIEKIEEYLIDHVLHIYANINKCSM